MSGPRLRVLSLGTGPQSSAIIVLPTRGEIPPFDLTVFADTGEETGKPPVDVPGRLGDHSRRSTGGRSGGDGGR